MYLCKQEHGFSVFLRVCNLEYLVPLSLHMYKSMFRPEVIRRVKLCFFRPCKTSILASNVRNPPRGYPCCTLNFCLYKPCAMCLSLLPFQPCAGSEPDCNGCLSNKYTYMQLRSPEVTHTHTHTHTHSPVKPDANEAKQKRAGYKQAKGEGKTCMDGHTHTHTHNLVTHSKTMAFNNLSYKNTHRHTQPRNTLEDHGVQQLIL